MKFIEIIKYVQSEYDGNELPIDDFIDSLVIKLYTLTDTETIKIVLNSIYENVL